MIGRFINKYRLLFALFCFLTITAFLIIGPLSKIPEKIEYGSEIGKIFYDLSIGYIVSYIFFYLVVFYKEDKDRLNINQRVSIQTVFIVIDGYSTFSIAFHDVPNLQNQFPPTLNNVREACLVIDPFTVSGYSIVDQRGSRTVNWQYLLKTRREEYLKYKDKIMSIVPFIDSELVSILNSIEDCFLFYQATNMIFPTQKNADFKDGTFMEKSLFDYLNLIYQLEIYIRKNFRDQKASIKLLDERTRLGFDAL